MSVARTFSDLCSLINVSSKFKNSQKKEGGELNNKWVQKTKINLNPGFTDLVGITTVIGTLNRGPALGIAISYPHT